MLSSLFSVIFLICIISFTLYFVNNYLFHLGILLYLSERRETFLARNDSLRRGNNIEMLILSILSTEDCYGYQLSLLIKDYSQGKISLPEGSLYPALYKLVDNGLISDEKRQVGKRLTRVYYHMEPEGKDYLNQLIEEYNSLHSGIQSILNKTKEGDELTHVQKTQ